MTGSQNEVGESLNLDVGSYLLNLGSTMYFGTSGFDKFFLCTKVGD